LLFLSRLNRDFPLCHWDSYLTSLREVRDTRLEAETNRPAPGRARAHRPVQ
jgi:hypothetical protein